MKKVLIPALILIAILFAITCSKKKSSPAAPEATSTTAPANTAAMTATTQATATATTVKTATATETIVVALTATETSVISPTASVTITITLTSTASPTITLTPCPGLSFGNMGSYDLDNNALQLTFNSAYTISAPVKLIGFSYYVGEIPSNGVALMCDSSGNVIAESPVTAATSTGWLNVTVIPVELAAGSYYLGVDSDTLGGTTGSNGGSTWGPTPPSSLTTIPTSFIFDIYNMGQGSGWTMNVEAICTCP